jgi:hypothetical protein
MVSINSKRELARVIGLVAGGTIFRVEINLGRIYLG